MLCINSTMCVCASFGSCVYECTSFGFLCDVFHETSKTDKHVIFTTAISENQSSVQKLGLSCYWSTTTNIAKFRKMKCWKWTKLIPEADVFGNVHAPATTETCSILKINMALLSTSVSLSTSDRTSTERSVVNYHEGVGSWSWFTHQSSHSFSYKTFKLLYITIGCCDAKIYIIS